MAPSRTLAPLTLNTASRMNNPRAVHTAAALQSQNPKIQTSQSPTQSAKIIQEWQDTIPNGADPDESVQEHRRGSLGTENYSHPSFQFPRSQPRKAQPVYTTPVLPPAPREQPMYTTPGLEMDPALQPEYNPPSLLSTSRAQHSIDKFPPLQPTPHPQPGYTTPVLQPTPRVHTPTTLASPEDPIYTTPVLQPTPRAQTPSISAYNSQSVQAPSQIQSQSGSVLNTQAFQAAVELQKMTPTPTPSVSAYNSYGLAAATRFVGSGRPKTGYEIEAFQAKVESEKEAQINKKKEEVAVAEGKAHSDLKGIEILPDPDPPHPSPKKVSPPTPTATPKPTMATMSKPTPTPIEPSPPTRPADRPPPTNHETQALTRLKRTNSIASIAETSLSLTSTTNPRTRLLISLPRARLRIIKLSRCPDTADLEEFLLQAVGIPARDKGKYEILWVRETERWGVEEVCMDGEDAWEFLREEVEGGVDGAEGKKGREVRIRVIEVGKE